MFRISLIALLVLLVAPVASLADSGRITMYDNMFYHGKPDTAQAGLQSSNIVYENRIWPHGVGDGALPERREFIAVVRARSSNPGPLVLDIESLPVSKGPPEAARRNMQTLATLADWARDAVPGKVVGFYGTNTLTNVSADDLPFAKELARHVDAFFPPMYAFDDDRVAWAKRASDEVAEAHALGPGRPVLFYLWPQYHDGTPKQFQFIDAAYWAFQLETSRRLADGVVIWSPGKFDWDDTTGWWSATLAFMQSMSH